jgi:Tol biopolymer transport system component
LDEPGSGADTGLTRPQQQDRLDSWKKIAAYLKREISTVQRWERREGMPVHRHVHDKQGSVFAYRSELDAWWESRRVRLEPQVAAEAPRTSARVFRLRASGWWLAAAIVLLCAALAVWLAAERPDDWRNPLAEARFTRLSDFAGTEQAAAISRDGKRVAFLAARDGRIDAWIGEIGGNSYRNLTSGALAGLADNPALRTLGFSPDSSLVSIWLRRADGSRPDDVNIFAAPAAGGALRLYLPETAEFDWSQEGTRLVYHTTAPGDPLFVRDPGAAPDRRIYIAPAGVHCHFPLWSPDDAFVYFVRGVPPDHWDLWRIRPSGSGLERLTSHNSRVSYPVLLGRRTVLYLATDADGSGPWIYALDVERRISHRVSYGLEGYTSLAASADGRRLVTTVANAHSSLWRISLGAARATRSSAIAPAAVAAEGATPRFGAGFLLYVSSLGGRPGLRTVTNGASREIWGGSPTSVLGSPAISPDGHHIVFSVAEKDRTDLYVVDHDGSGAKVVASGLVLRGSPAWGPDGRSVLAAVVRDGEPHLTRFFLDGEAPLPLVSEYSVDPVWSPDGRFLIYSGADVGTTFPLRAAAADGRPYPLPSLILTRGARRVAFLDGPRTLVILRGGIGHKDLALFDLNTGTEQLLAELPADFVIRDFDVAADGSEILLERTQENSDLALIERGSQRP